MNKNHQTKTVVHPAAIDLLTDATWEFAHNILWNRFPFGQGEIALSKFLIREYYENIPAEQFQQTAAKHFSGYCERILMAKEYVSRFPHRYIPHPCIWLNRLNPKGFAGTKRWYMQKQQQCKEQHCCEQCRYSAFHSDNNFENHFYNRA